MRLHKSYRVDSDLFDAASAKAAAAGDTLSDVITRAFQAYVDGTAPVLPAPPGRPATPGEIAVKVNTAREAMDLGRALAAQRRPARSRTRPGTGEPDGCRHPVNRRLGATCGACGRTVAKK